MAVGGSSEESAKKWFGIPNWYLEYLITIKYWWGVDYDLFDSFKMM